MGHGFRPDLRVWHLLEDDLNKSNLGILDAQRIAAEIMSYGFWKLYTLLEELGSPYDKPRNAGNDAYFTPRTLLVSGIRSCSNEIVDRNDSRDIFITLDPIIQAPSPKRCDILHEKSRKEKPKRLERSRKHQIRLWDVDTQTQIRAEWGLRRKEVKSVSGLHGNNETMPIRGEAGTRERHLIATAIYRGYFLIWTDSSSMMPRYTWLHASLSQSRDFTYFIDRTVSISSPSPVGPTRESLQISILCV